MLVTLTDGFSSRGIEITKELAERLKRIGVRLYSVGTSDKIYKAQLDGLASKPTSKHELIIDLRKYQTTKDQVEQFAKEICESESAVNVSVSVTKPVFSRERLTAVIANRGLVT